MEKVKTFGEFINEAEEAKTTSFTIPEKLKKLYQITDSLKVTEQ